MAIKISSARERAWKKQKIMRRDNELTICAKVYKIAKAKQTTNTTQGGKKMATEKKTASKTATRNCGSKNCTSKKSTRAVEGKADAKSTNCVGKKSKTTK